MQDERHLSFKARLENVPDACEFVVRAAEEAGLDERSVYHCQLAVDEACTNIIEHGFGDQPNNGQITVMTGIEGKHTFVITIADNSPAFNPLTYREADPTQSLEERAVGGWGIYFIKKLMDMVDYRYSDGRNNLALYKKIEHPLPVSRSEIDDILTIRRHPVANGFVQIDLKGQIDSHTSQQVEDALEQELSQHHYRLLVSFAHVTYISSSGLKVLVTAWRKAREQKGDVVLAALQARILEVFEMIGFDMMFNIYDSPEAALADMHYE